MASDDTNRGGDTPGTALTPIPEGGIEPFIAAAQASPRPARGLWGRLLDYSAHAAVVIGLSGVAWTIGNHLTAQPTAAQIEAPTKTKTAAASVPVTAMPAATAARPDEVADLRDQNKHLSDEIVALRSNLDALRASLRQDKTPVELRALQADLKTVKSGLDSTKSQTDAALAQLSGRVEKLQQQPPASKMQQLVDRLGRLEHGTTDAIPTGSIKHAEEASVVRAVPTPPAKPTQVASTEDRPGKMDEAPAKPQMISGWVVRDVYDGVALIEGKRGPMEVVPGVSIPGAGVVRSIDRHGSGWTVTTSKGQLAYAAPPRDVRRANYRDYYERYPDDD